MNAVDLAPQSLRYFDRVRAGLLVHIHPHAGLAIHADQVIGIFVAVLDNGNVAHVNRHSAPRGEHHVTDFVQAPEFPSRPQEHVETPFLDRAYRTVHVLASQDLDNIGNRQFQCPQLLEVEIDVDLATQPAAHGECSDSRYPLQPVLQLLLHVVPQFLGIHVVGGYGHVQDRVLRRVVLVHARRFHVFGEIAPAPVQAGPQLVGRFVNVDAIVEADTHVAQALVDRAGNPFHVRRGGERFLERSHHQGLHLLGRYALVLGTHADRRVDDLGHEVDRNIDEGDSAQQDRYQAKHQDRNRSVDRGRGKIHGKRAGRPASATLLNHTV